MLKKIKINGVDYPHPQSFRMKPVPNIVASITTMNGRNIADVNGWVYSDVTLSWEWIDSDELTQLIADTDPMQGTFEFTFNDMNTGQESTVNAIRTGVGGTMIATVTPDGKVHWKDIEMTLSFPDCYV